MSFQPPSDPYELVKGLRVVRRYRPEPIEPADVTAILEAGRWTGSAKNEQAWAFIVVDDPEQRDRLAETGRYTKPLREAPLTVVPVGLPGAYEWDLGRVSQNMMLAARTRQVGSCPVTLHDSEGAREVLGLPAGHVARYALCFGYPDSEAELAARDGGSFSGRKSLDDLVVRNRWS